MQLLVAQERKGSCLQMTLRRKFWDLKTAMVLEKSGRTLPGAADLHMVNTLYFVTQLFYLVYGVVLVQVCGCSRV